MTFKEIYQNMAEHLQLAINGKKVVFTHGKFYGYEFQIVAKKKEVKR